MTAAGEKDEDAPLRLSDPQPRTGAGGADQDDEPPPAGAAPAWIWDPDRLRVTWANAAGLELWGERSVAALFARRHVAGDQVAREHARAVREAERGRTAVALDIRPGEARVAGAALCASCRLPDGRRGLRVTLPAAPDFALASADLMRRIFDLGPEPLVLFDAGGGVVERNEADFRVFADAADIADRFVRPAEAERALARALEDGETTFLAQAHCQTGRRLMRVEMRRLRDPGAGAPLALASFREEADDAAGEAAEGGVPREALARIAHDFRSPLNAVLGYVELLLRQPPGAAPELQREYLRDISRAGLRLLRLADDFVELGRAGLSPTVSEVSPGAVLEETLRQHEMDARMRRIDLSPSFDGAGTIRTDEHALWRILDNLLRNAVAHAEETVEATLTDAGEDGVLIEIADDGPGMSEEELREALRPFATASRRRPASRGGGLGLTVASELAAGIGARLEFGGTPGEGLVARLILPREIVD